MSSQPSWVHANGIRNVCYQVPSNRYFRMRQALGYNGGSLCTGVSKPGLFSTAVDKMDREKDCLHSD